MEELRKNGDPQEQPEERSNNPSDSATPGGEPHEAVPPSVQHGQHRHVRIIDEPGGTDAHLRPDDKVPPHGPPHKIKADLRQDELVKGAHPGDRYIRVGRNVGPFRRKSAGLLAASLAADQPRGAVGRTFYRIKRVMLGAPISTEHSLHERLTNVKALAILSSDALSSVAYATEEILRILVLAGAAALAMALPLGFGIIILLVIVVTSYRQTIAAYPRGGGSYIVAKDNLGTMLGLTAASSILIGYTLTVAVSVSAGVAAIYSLAPGVEKYKVELCVAIIILITIANLRGVREAGNIFAVPTYLFIFGMIALVAVGLVRISLGIGGFPVYDKPPDAIPFGTETLTLLLLMRAFTQGSAALTGVEAIADGVPAFKPPEAKNARTTLLWMGVLSVLMFGGITYLAYRLGIIPSASETVVSQIARTIFPPILGVPYLWYFIQITTALILVLAANTAFSDFPRLSYFLARDKFMPHQYAFRGDRLAFSWGIVTLAVLACVLVIVFNGDTSALIPLYSIGVFGAFTLSQSGMVVRWWRTRSENWLRNLIINGIGALTTLAVFLISAITKFEHGTWIVLILIPVIIALFLSINRHYRRFATDVAAVTPMHPDDIKHTIIVPISSLNAIALSALAYARSITPNVTAVHIAEGEDLEEVKQFDKEWHELMPDTDIPMVLIESPYRSLVGPLLSYIDALDQQSPDDTITIVVPELIPAKPWEYVLHNQTALRLKAALLFRPNTVVANIPYIIGRNSQSQAARRRARWRLVLAPTIVAAFLVLLFYYFFLAH